MKKVIFLFLILVGCSNAPTIEEEAVLYDVSTLVGLWQLEAYNSYNEIEIVAPNLLKHGSTTYYMEATGENLISLYPEYINAYKQLMVVIEVIDDNNIRVYSYENINRENLYYQHYERF